MSTNEVTEKKTRTVTAIDIKKFLGYPDAGSFANDWRKLTAEDKEELLDSLQALKDAGKYVSV